MKKQLLTLSTLFALLGLSNSSNAQSPALVKDIRGGTSSSTPSDLGNCNGTLYLRVTNAGDGLGSELWKSDGTTAGTVLVKDIRVGSQSSFPLFFTDLAGLTYFTADDGINGTELWTTDGTAAGTVMLKDINPGSGSSWGFYDDPHFTKANGLLFFVLDNAASGMELWKTDGTAAGTIMVKDINPGTADSNPANLINYNDTLYFSANNGTDGAELWKSDGTSAGTVMVNNINPGSANSSPTEFVERNDTLYFKAGGTTGTELWKTDGSTVGTVLIYGGFNYLSNMADVNGTLFFSAGTSSTNYELWKSNGTAAGTGLVLDIRPGSVGSAPYNIMNVNGTAVFKCNDGIAGQELWKSDGTAVGTVLVKDINPGATGSMTASGVSTSWFTMVNDTLFFVADNGTSGYELWKSDGTTAGTIMYEINPGTPAGGPSFLVNVNGVLFFSGTEAPTGAELWKYPGTGASTTDITSITATNDYVVFPNPSTGEFQLTISNPSSEAIQLKVIDVLGKEVYSEKLSQGITNHNLDLSHLPNGIYMLHNNNTSAKKIIIQK